MELQDLSVMARTPQNKGAARRTRAQGLIPGIIYGGQDQPAAVMVNERVFMHLLQGRYGEHAVLKIAVEGKPELDTTVMLKGLQHHPVSGAVQHIDFLRIRLDEVIQTSVPVEATGQARGVVEGGVLDHVLREVQVECLALDVPEKFVVDISDLGIGDNVTVADIAVPENVKVLTDLESSVFAVHAPRVAEEAAAGEGEEQAAEPELVGGSSGEED